MGDRLKGRTALITGGASGIGRAIAGGFAQEGARVHIGDVSGQRCAQAAEAIGQGAAGHALDIRDRQSIERLMQRLVAEGGVDVLVNCAGVFGMQVLTEVTEAEFARIFSVNVLGTLLMTQAVARAMIARGRGGTVVNIASGAGRRPAPGSVVYSASKAAVISLTQCAALELIPHGIRVNAIAPGAVRTPMWNQVESIYAATLGPGTGTAEAAQVALTPIGRMSAPEEYVGGAIYLACEDSAYVVGQTLNVDGGMNLG
jgi:NAD(P)-dependent dehydrogenase (short-subunit alcohol dehydrogenase family)